MSHLDPDRFGDLLERSFVTEPADQPSVQSHLRAGRRRLRRQRATRTLGTLGVAGALLASYVALTPGPGDVGPADLSDATMVERCLDARAATSWHRDQMTGAEVARAMGDAELMTRASTTYADHATLLSADGRSWMACTVATDARSREKTLSFLYRTDVTLPTREVDGRTVTDRFAENDESLARASDLGDLTWGVDCFPTGVTEDTPAFQVASARCATFTVSFTNRLPREVAEVRVVNPDGTTRSARTRDGFVSYGYSAEMTPELRRTYRVTPAYRLDELVSVTFLDREGAVLGRGSYPTLDVTLEKDVEP